MKKLIVILAMVALATTPVLASVTMTVAQVGTSLSATVSYAVSDPCTVRAFALDITVNNSKTITAVTCSNSSYYIYPGSISIVGGSVSAYGSCVCDASKYVGTQAGIGTAGVTVEMGSLYTGGGKPNTSGTLLTFTVSDRPCTATVNVNSARGGIVMENPDESPGHNLPQPVVFASTSCYTGSHGADWAAVGSPSCWCKSVNPRQCHGDADGTKEQKSNYWVYSNDFTILLAAWQKTYAQIQGQTAGTLNTPMICADFTQTGEQKSNYRVYSSDFTILLAGWQKANLPASDCP